MGGTIERREDRKTGNQNERMKRRENDQRKEGGR